MKFLQSPTATMDLMLAIIAVRICISALQHKDDWLSHIFWHALCIVWVLIARGYSQHVSMLRDLCQRQSAQLKKLTGTLE